MIFSTTTNCLLAKWAVAASSGLMSIASPPSGFEGAPALT
jgi:hypothetical protein